MGRCSVRQGTSQCRTRIRTTVRANSMIWMDGFRFRQASGSSFPLQGIKFSGPRVAKRLAVFFFVFARNPLPARFPMRYSQLAASAAHGANFDLIFKFAQMERQT